MKPAPTILGALAIAVATCASAADEGSGRRAAPPEKPSWEFALTAYPTNVRGGGDFEENEQTIVDAGDTLLANLGAGDDDRTRPAGPPVRRSNPAT